MLRCSYQQAESLLLMSFSLVPAEGSASLGTESGWGVPQSDVGGVRFLPQNYRIL